MIPEDHKPLLAKLKKVFVEWNSEPLTPEEKELEAYHEIKKLYDGFGFPAIRFAYRNAKGKRDFIRHVKRATMKT